MSLESFLATGRAVASDGIDLERTEQSLGNDGAKTDNVSTPPRVAPREDRAGAIDSSVADDELEDDDEGFGYPLGLVKLVDVYTFRMSQTVSTWSTNLRKMTATQPLREAEDGTLWTASDVEFFRLLNEQLEVATDGGQQLVSAAAVVFSSALLDFASQQHKRLGGDASANPPIAATGLSALSSPTHFRRPSTIAGGLLERTPQDRLAVAADANAHAPTTDVPSPSSRRTHPACVDDIQNVRCNALTTSSCRSDARVALVAGTVIELVSRSAPSGAHRTSAPDDTSRASDGSSFASR
mgnify:CR=1 FL=1